MLNFLFIFLPTDFDSQAWTMANDAIRFSVPMGLNISESYDAARGGTSLLEMKSMLSPATDPFEQEQRRNIFWLAYHLDQQ